MQNMKINDKNQEWIGNIPKNWTFKKIKYVLAQRNEKNIPIKSKDILSLTAKQGVIPYTEKEGGGNKPKTDFSAYKLAYPGDIVMNSMNILSGAVGLSKYFGCVSPVYYMLYCSNDEDDIRYFYYVFANKAFQSSLLGIGNGILMKESENGTFNTIRMRIPIEKLNNMSIPYPKPEIQKAIANFLDKKIGKIDEVSKKIQQEITDLEKYRKSIITTAVTTGLNKNIQMKDSNIDYINKMPSTWHLTRLKYILTERNQRSIDGKEMLLSVSQKKGVLPAYQVKRSIKANSLVGYKFVKQNDLVFNKLNPALARFGVTNYNGITSPDFSVYYSNKINIHFLSFLLKTSKYVTEYKRLCSGVGEGYTRLYTPTLYNIKVALPTIKEQNKIVNILNKKDQKIKKLMEKQKRLLLTLTQYKQSLIYEYVTGKKQVSSKESAKA